jgi:hypothetical protein
MFVNKQIYFLIAIAMVLSLFLVQQQVFAQWEGPIDGPGSGGTINPPATNPMTADFDLGTNDIINADSGTFSGDINASSGTFSGDIQVGTLNTYDIDDFLSGGGLSNPMTEHLLGANLYAIKDLRSCDNPEIGKVCGGLETAAAKNSDNKAYTVGVYGTTIEDSGVNPSFGVYGISNNTGGVGVYGTVDLDGDSKHSWAGYFQGAFGVNGDSLFIGDMYVDQDTDSLLRGCFRFDQTKRQMQYSDDCNAYTSFADLSGGGGGLGEVKDDASPQLGGGLDLNNYNITGSGAIDITGSATIADRLIVGIYPTSPATPVNSGGVIELGKYHTQSNEGSSLIYSGPSGQDQAGVYFDIGATGNGNEIAMTEFGQLALGYDMTTITDTVPKLLVKGTTSLEGDAGADDGTLEVGLGASAEERGAVAIGRSSSVTGDFSTAIGYGTGVSGFRSMALGNNINVSGDASMGIGLDYTGRTLAQNNTLAIMGGKVGVNVLDPVWDVEVEGTIFAKSDTIAPIIGWGFGGTDYANAGVEGVGDIGVYAFGSTVGLYADGQYGAVTRGTVPGTTNPPDDPGDLGDHGNISSLFGINQVLADENTPAALGSVAIGGYVGGGTLTAAGLGLCALSGETAWGLDNVANYDYFAYCQDAGGKNNYAGFFAGDVYTKGGSLQINDSLDSASENLIYANAAASAASGSSLLKLQNNGSTKFSISEDGDVDIIDDNYPRIFLSTNGSDGGKMEYDHGLQALKFITTPTHNHDIIFGDSWLKLDNTDDSAHFKGDIVLDSAGSLLDFNGGGEAGPDCKSGSEGKVYYFSRYDVLCVCDGTGWESLMNSVTNNGYCTNNPYSPT